jgi:hypothetical protein
MSANKSREPLLYIQQPEIVYPKAEMQQTYVVRKAELVSENTVLNKPVADKESKLDKTLESNDNKQTENHLVQSNEEETKEKSLSNIVIDEGELQSKIQNEELPSSDIQDVIHQYHKDQNNVPSTKSTRKKQSYSFNRVKSFKEMNTIERLNYLVHFPKLLPPVPCVFVTKSRSVKGFLVKRTEDAIEIKQFNEKMLQIPLGELIEVKMIGLK